MTLRYLMMLYFGDILFVLLLSKCDAENMMTMKKSDNFLFDNSLRLSRVARDVAENGSGTSEDISTNEALLRKHTDIYVFSNDTNPAISLIWSGSNGVMLALTTMNYGLFGASKLYRSTDYGRSFRDISGRIGNQRVRNSHGLLVSPLDSTLVILVQETLPFSNGIIFVSSDSGYSFDRISLKFALNPSTLNFNPHNSLKILASSSTNGLWMSYDFGKVWHHISDNILQVRWDPLDTDTFYYSKDPTGIMRAGSFNNELYRCDVNSLSCNKIAEHIYSFGIQGGFLFISVEYLNKNGSRVMHVSKDRGATWEAAQIPLIGQKQFYSLLDMSEGMVFVHVDADGGKGSGTIFTSDEKGVIYDRSLDHHLYPSTGSLTDFYKVSSLQGVYITSQLSTDALPTIHSMITFNKGGTWQKIDPPKGSKCLPTEKECQLQIHSLFSRSKGLKIPEFPKSTSSATGIILAHGNLGDALNFNEPNIYVSNDGGYTWVQPKELVGPHFYAIGDSGGLLYAVTSKEETNLIFYSTDEGLTWESYKFVDKPFIVTGLSVEPGSKTTVVGLWGWDKSGDGAWRSVTVDFKPILKKPCDKQDYVQWKAHESNTGYDEESCLLGADIIFTRRKKGTVCENGKDYVTQVNVKSCECQKTDYLCDYGYIRQGLDCIRDTNIENYKDICIDGEGEMIETKGYRKIPGDKCQNGFTPKEAVINLNKKCLKTEVKKEEFGVDKGEFTIYEPEDEEDKKGASGGLIAVLVLVILALVISLIILIRRRNKSGKRVKYMPVPSSDQYGATNTSVVDEEQPVNHVPTTDVFENPLNNHNKSNKRISYHDDSDEDMLIS